MSFAPDHETAAKPETLLRVPVGFASPLWGLFAGAAVSGAAWWWMTRWTRPQNLEAMFGATVETETVREPVIAALAAPALEAVEVVEAVYDVGGVQRFSDLEYRCVSQLRAGPQR